MEWTNDELQRIGDAEELRIAGRKADGTLRQATIIWVVRVGDELYVRSVNGRSSAWFRGVLVRHNGRIWAGGVEKDVTFVETPDSPRHAAIDAAYREKYGRYPQEYVEACLTPKAHAATLKLVPAS
ncbi:MAG: DUF2255 family protein [Ardenticatenaceae bacterium]|nr:DUF2255 family protein [Ardenticatenaceae bacterium]